MWPSVGRDRTLACPGAQSGDLFAPHHRERSCAPHLVEQCGECELSSRRKRGVEARHDDAFDFGSAEPIGRMGQGLYQWSSQIRLQSTGAA